MNDIANYILYVLAITYITYILLLTKTSFGYATNLQVLYRVNGELEVRSFGLIDWLIINCTNWYDLFSADSYEMKDTYFTYMMRCPYCLSMWVNLVGLGYLYHHQLYELPILGLMVFATPYLVGRLLEDV